MLGSVFTLCPNLIWCLLFVLSFVCPQAKYISTCIDEIKQELKQDNIAVKANAVCKLTYVRSVIANFLSKLTSEIHPFYMIVRGNSVYKLSHGKCVSSIFSQFSNIKEALLPFIMLQLF